MTLDGIRLSHVDADMGAHPAGRCCHGLARGDTCMELMSGHSRLHHHLQHTPAECPGQLLRASHPPAATALQAAQSAMPHTHSKYTR